MRTIVHAGDLVAHANEAVGALRTKASRAINRGGFEGLLEAGGLLGEAQAVQKFVREILNKYAINVDVDQKPAQAGEANNESVEEST